MRTSDLIEKLAASHKPVRPSESPTAFVAKWLGACLLMCALAWLVLPVRSDLAQGWTRFQFISDSVLWLSLSLIATAAAYLSFFPGRKTRNLARIEAVVFLLFTALIASRLFGASSALAELEQELDPRRGWCGPLIFVIGSAVSVFLFLKARTLAPVQQRLSTAWIMMASGCMGSFAVHFVCAHENALHVYMWHFTPIVLLVMVGSFFISRVLRW